MRSRWLQAVTSIINAQTALIVLLSIISTWFCRRYDLYAELPLTLVGTAVIFPIVFSIGGAYSRREKALDDYGDIKAHGRALYFATRDWIDDTDEELQSELRGLLYRLLDDCRRLFSSPVDAMPELEASVYTTFSDLSRFINGLRTRGLPSGEASRCNQFLSKMVISFEHVKHVYQYRTPRTLRAYSRVFIYALPVIYGPYFAAIALDYSSKLAYVMPVLLSVVLVSLENIQEHPRGPVRPDRRG